MDVQPMGSSDTSEATLARFEAMLRARVIDERLATLGESGLVGFLPRLLGREAALVGVVAGLREEDWIFPAATDWAVPVARGLRMEAFLNRIFGNAKDPLRGHVPDDHGAEASPT